MAAAKRLGHSNANVTTRHYARAVDGRDAEIAADFDAKRARWAAPVTDGQGEDVARGSHDGPDTGGRRGGRKPENGRGPAVTWIPLSNGFRTGKNAELDRLPSAEEAAVSVGQFPARRCGCGQPVTGTRKFMNQDHYSVWLRLERFLGRHRKQP
jgi:hypothetical protein